MKRLGLKIIVLLLTINSSLAQHSSSVHNRFYRGITNSIFNDSAKFSLEFPYSFKVLNQQDYESLVQKINIKLNKSIRLDKNDILFCIKSDSLNINILVLLASTETISLISKFDYELLENKSKLFFKKNSKKQIIFYTLNNEHFLFLISKNSNNNKAINNNQIKAAISILEKVRIGSNYQNFTPPDPFSLSDKTFNSSSNGNYLLPLVSLNSIQEFYPEKDSRKFSYFGQAALTYNSFIGQNKFYKSLLKKFEFFKNDSLLDNASKNNNFLADSSAIKKIIEESSTKQIVMFNETHLFPKQRYFVSLLLQQLYQKGFRYLALEALFDTTINSRHFPLQSSGFYTREPQMSNLIRNAIRLGYTLIPYEDKNENSTFDQREKNQAINLYNNTIKKDKNARVVVLCGGGHNIKDTTANRVYMAGYFLKISGVNPLVIRSYFNYCTYEYKNKIFLFDAKSYVKASREYQVENQCDYIIANNYMENDFRLYPQSNIKDIDYSISLPKLTTTDQTLVVGLIYIKEEFDRFANPVPIFTWLIDESTKMINAKLPFGSYIFLIKNETGNILFTKELFIKK